MGNIPLHPLLVHFPLVLAILLPAVLVALYVAVARGKTRSGAWWVGVVVSGLLVVSAIAALKTGEQDEELVEDIVPRQSLELHEERADFFVWVAAGTLLLTFVTAMLGAGRMRTVMSAASIVAALAVAGSAVAVGHSGGSLVYEHNAAAVHSGSGQEMVGQAWNQTEEHEDDREGHERRVQSHR